MNELIKAAKAAGRNLFEHEAWELFRAYDIPTRRCYLAKTVDEATVAASEIGYPIVLKIVSKDILHKSEAGGVKVNLTDEQSLQAGFFEIMQSVSNYKPDAQIEGILVCEMLHAGLETIIGMTRDASFGPTMMFGLGGIFVEVLRDVSFRVLPLSNADVMEMIGEIKGYKLLQGIRGEKPKDIDALAQLLLKVANMIEENPEIVELDINPCFIYEQGAMPADARVML
ncbi:MAG: acetate--CoA ligase family protein [Eubacteriales bacterium]|jgi:acetyl-CoA synthetase (ADP-forming)|nr:acetate--CoA ligase family protein [Eubacteriales bacterium]